MGRMVGCLRLVVWGWVKRGSGFGFGRGEEGIYMLSLGDLSSWRMVSKMTATAFSCEQCIFLLYLTVKTTNESRTNNLLSIHFPQNTL